MVSAHFAVPVVGVVVCAVLVFAFGFKSPVQPPSFDLLNEDDHRKYRRSRQKKVGAVDPRTFLPLPRREPCPLNSPR